MTTDDAGSAPEADADSTRFSSGTTEPAPAESRLPATDRRRGSQARAAWRRWRRSRPFWGGLLLVLAGLELLALPLTGVLAHGAIKLVIYIGIGGVFGVLIGILLIAAGIVLWVNPTHRVFYGIAGIVLGIVSFPASNLGGFVLGMLLAIIGGALAFAWVPAEPESVDVAPAGRAGDDAPEGRADDNAPEGRDAGDEEPSDGLDLMSGTRAEWEGTATIAEEAAPAPEEAAPASDGGAYSVGDGAAYRTLAVAAMPAVLVAGLLGTSGAARAASTPQSGGCILGIICMPTPSPSPSPSPSPTTSVPTPSPTPTAPSSSAPSAPGSPSPTPSSGQSGTGTPTATPSTSATASPSPSGTSTKAAKSAAKGKKAAPKDAAPPGVTASAAASVLTAGSVTLTDFQYLGNVSVPVSGGASEEMMEFTASSADLSGDVTVSVTQGGLTTDTSSPTLGFNDDMTLYATKLCGNLFGVLPICFTPSTVSAVLLSIANLVTAAAPITMTDVITDQPLTTAGTLQTGSLTVGF
jgi:Family of unknown function (DUF6114)